MMANANHQIINISRNFSNFRESKLYPFIIIPSSSSSSILLLQQRIRIRKHIHGLSCVSEKSGSTLVQQRPPSKDEVVEMMIDQTVEEGSTNLNGMEESEEVEYLVREYGWKVRRMVEDMNEMRMVADIQAYSFHVPSLVFDDWFFQFFKAEVLAGLLYRLRNSPPDRYTCLVAEPAKEDNKVIGSTKSQAHQNHQQLVGVVDVTVFRDADVLPHLLGAEEYLYISGIAVSNNFRRQKVATVLLKACEVIAVLWGYEYLVLRAYEDDWGARSLYTNAGFQIVSRDPIWVTLIGRKRRILMTKRLPFVS